MIHYKGITLVTGATGFIGSHLVEYLAKQEVRVRAKHLGPVTKPLFLII